MSHEELLKLRNQALDMVYVMPSALGPSESHRSFEMKKQALLQFATAADHLLSWYPQVNVPAEDIDEPPAPAKT
jgi:hypothetical protein